MDENTADAVTQPVVAEETTATSPQNGHEINLELESSLDDDFDLEDDGIVTISGLSQAELRLVKSEIEERILKNIPKLKRDTVSKISQGSKKRKVTYHVEFMVDTIGNKVTLGETGIAEGWSIPKYEIEYQNLLGLPFTEDFLPPEWMKNKRPRQECFNCMSTAHGVRDCPAKFDEERVAIHRRAFTSNVGMRDDHMNLGNSARYSSDVEQPHRGITPGKVSKQLREALGISERQLPPWIYVMRVYGYPPGWLLEARVATTKLHVHNGDGSNGNGKESLDDDPDIAVIDENGKELPIEVIEYDGDKIYDFEGFNQMPSKETIDESDRYGVRTYGTDLSKTNFMSTLKLENKKKIVSRRSITSNLEADGAEQPEEIVLDSTQGTEVIDDDTQIIEEDPENIENDVALSPEMGTGHGVSFTEIPGTPIVDNQSGVSRVPDHAAFSSGICEHKPFDMEGMSTTGSYQNIVKLTKEYKDSLNTSLTSQLDTSK